MLYEVITINSQALQTAKNILSPAFLDDKGPDRRVRVNKTCRFNDFSPGFRDQCFDSDGKHHWVAMDYHVDLCDRNHRGDVV